MTAVKTVLVADDTAFVRDRFKEAIESAGHRAMTVGTSQELLALAGARSVAIDLIVLDLQLPGGTGLDLLRALKALDRRQPVVVFSGTITSPDDVRGLGSLGVTGYLNEYTAAQNILPALAPHLFPDLYRRRSTPRVTLGIPVSYRFGNTIATATMLNVSGGGLAIRTTTPLAAGTAIRLRFRLPGRKDDIEADAAVVWVDRKLGMGARFSDVEGTGQSALDEFVQRHFFSNRKA